MPAATSSEPGRAKPFGYARAIRLAQPAEFVAALRQRPAVRSSLFAIHLRARAEAFPWRFGLVVAKRYETRAIGRNSIKRVWREALRAVAPTLEKSHPSHDLVVRLLAKPGQRDLCLLKRDCKAEADRLLLELQDKLAKANQEIACADSSSL
jgi:ribonuclease P protein component